MRTCSTGGAHYAQGLKAKLQCRSVSEGKDNPLGSTLRKGSRYIEGATNPARERNPLGSTFSTWSRSYARRYQCGGRRERNPLGSTFSTWSRSYARGCQ